MSAARRELKEKQRRASEASKKPSFRTGDRWTAGAKRDSLDPLDGIGGSV